MRITSVTTKVGDRGTTRLVGGVEVSKDEPRIEAYGTVDELNATVGVVRAHLATSAAPAEARARLDLVLARVQNDLFDVGADLATRPPDRWPQLRLVGAEDHARLEAHIESLNDELPPLREFVLPGGGLVGAHLHVARTVCRRAERRVVTLVRTEPDTGTGCLVYLNRLSDLLFVAGRWAARALGEPEVLWQRS